MVTPTDENNSEQLPHSLARAMDIIRTERRAAVLDVRVAVSDTH